MPGRDGKKPRAGGMNRRGLLKVYGLDGHRGRLGLKRRRARTFGLIGEASAAEAGLHGLYFVQISDSHIGFILRPTPDRRGTLIGIPKRTRMINGFTEADHTT
jgi:hypothetical protein